MDLQSVTGSTQRTHTVTLTGLWLDPPDQKHKHAFVSGTSKLWFWLDLDGVNNSVLTTIFNISIPKCYVKN